MYESHKPDLECKDPDIDTRTKNRQNKSMVLQIRRRIPLGGVLATGRMPDKSFGMPDM